jgi:class 3 adenylate cyclase
MIEVDKERRFAEIPGVHAQRRRPVLDTPYISRVLPLDKATATAATDAWHSGRASMAGGRRPVARHGLRLRQTFEPTDFDPLLLRRLFGTLSVNWWPVAVEIELVQYSRCASEIALRPSKKSWPVLTEHYERGATRAVEEIVNAIMADAQRLAEQPTQRITHHEGRDHRVVDGDACRNAYGLFLTKDLSVSDPIELGGPEVQLGQDDPSVEQLTSFLGTLTFRGDTRARVLASVVFTDVVASTATLAAVGDRRWNELLEMHDRVTERLVKRFWGRLVNRMGDGLVATFDCPARAVRCAEAICREIGLLGIKVRAGVHVGEIELRGDEIRGIAVHIAARVMKAADAGEVVVTRTVKDLTAGSGLRFADRGVQELKGIPEPWQLLALQL